MEVVAHQGSCNTPGELWYVVHHIYTTATPFDLRCESVTYIHTYLHTYTHTHIHTYTHTHIHAHIHIYHTHTLILTYSHTHILT